MIGILYQEMEQNITQMQLYGYKKEAIAEYRRTCENSLQENIEPAPSLIPISRFEQQGVSIGKENKTKVKR